MSSLQVATFNIRHGLGVDGQLSLERTARVIDATGASVVGVQEIDRFWPRSGSVDQAEELARLTGMQMAFHPTFTRGSAEYGIGILSREPVKADYTKLPRAGGEEPRGVIAARLEGITVLVTHLSQVSTARAAQIEKLLEVAESADPPVVIMGDFNATRRGLNRIAEAGFSSGASRSTTFPRRGWGRQIDFIFAGRGAQVIKVGTLKSAASDHLPLRAQVARG